MVSSSMVILIALFGSVTISIATFPESSAALSCYGESLPGFIDRSGTVIRLVRRPWLSHDLVSAIAQSFCGRGCMGSPSGAWAI